MKKNKYLTEYYKDKDKIIVSNSNMNKIEILKTKENELDLLEKMKKDYINVFSNKPFSSCKKNKFIRGIYSLLFSMPIFASSYLLIKNGINPFATFDSPSNIYWISSSMFLFNTIKYYKIKALVNVKEKYRLFFDNEKEINTMIRKHSSVINNLSNETKKEISENIFNYMEYPINVNTLRLIKLKELKKVLNEIKNYQDSIQNNDFDTLKKETKSKKYTYKNSNS